MPVDTMNDLIGSEVEISEVTEESLLCARLGLEGQRVVTPTGTSELDDDDDYDVHQSLTPLQPHESLFLQQNLETSHISAAALAQQIHQAHRPWTSAFTSTLNQDDFVTADEDMDASTFLVQNRSFDSTSLIFPNDALDYSRITEMSTTTTPAPKQESTMHVDAAEKVYDTAKGVWGWGKSVIIFSPFLGATEAIAGKIVETLGSNLEDIDSKLVHHLHGIDDNILNPAITKVVDTVMGAVSKSEDILKPIILGVLKPIGIIKDEPASDPELTPVKK